MTLKAAIEQLAAVAQADGLRLAHVTLEGVPCDWILGQCGNEPLPRIAKIAGVVVEGIPSMSDPRWVG